VFAVEPQDLDIGDRGDRRGARAVVQQGDLSEDIAGLRHLEHQLLALVVVHENLYFAGTDDVERVAGVAVDEDGLARRILEQVNLLGQSRLFLVAKLVQVFSRSASMGMGSDYRTVYVGCTLSLLLRLD
jgi:hypothetical protein